MVFRKFLARLSGCRKWDTHSEESPEGIDPPVPLRPWQSQLAVRPFDPIPPTLQRRNSDGSRASGRFGFNRASRFDSGAKTGAVSEISPVPVHYLSVPGIDEIKPVELSSYTVDPTAAYENKPDWKSTLQASAGLAIDVLKESSDVFTPLKSVAGGLSAILKHYDVWHPYFSGLFIPLVFEPASDGEP
jgi:hypothetical protein